MQDKELVVDLVHSVILGRLCISVIGGIKSRWCNVVRLGGPLVRSCLQKAFLQPAFAWRRWKPTSHLEELVLRVEHLLFTQRLLPWQGQGIAVTSEELGAVDPFEYLKTTHTCCSAFVLLLALPSPVSGHAQESSHSTPCPAPGAAFLPGPGAQVCAQHCCCLWKAACGPVQTPGTIPRLGSLNHPCRLAGVGFDGYPGKIFSRSVSEWEMRIKIVSSISPSAPKFPLLSSQLYRQRYNNNVWTEVNSGITEMQR